MNSKNNPNDLMTEEERELIRNAPPEEGLILLRAIYGRLAEEKPWVGERMTMAPDVLIGALEARNAHEEVLDTLPSRRTPEEREAHRERLRELALSFEAAEAKRGKEPEED